MFESCRCAAFRKSLASNVFLIPFEFRRAGNYPSQVLFSCRNHRNLDMKQEEFHQCEVCERLFREDSMWSEIVCRVCYDMKNLHNKVGGGLRTGYAGVCDGCATT